MKRERIQIEGMGCNHCVAAVRTALEGVGVSVLDVTIGQAEVRYDETAIERSQVDEAVEAAGYQVVAHDPADTSFG